MERTGGRGQGRGGEETETALDVVERNDYGIPPRSAAQLEFLLTSERAHHAALNQQMVNETAQLREQLEAALNSSIGCATDESVARKLWKNEKMLWNREKVGLETQEAELKARHREEIRMLEGKHAELLEELRDKIRILEAASQTQTDNHKAEVTALNTALTALNCHADGLTRRLGGLLGAKFGGNGKAALLSSAQPPAQSAEVVEDVFGGGAFGPEAEGKDEEPQPKEHKTNKNKHKFGSRKKSSPE